ncbi:MAG: rod-binding protein [Treponema sp.]|jgi:flagellar protein FlgJ|nr:rod-binding protein [Treponema sp.]
MDINALGVQYLDSTYVPLSSAYNSTAETPVMRNGSSGSFEELLKKAQSPSQPAASAASNGKTPINKNDKLYELCVELETFLLKNLIKSMRSTVQKTKLIDTGFAGEVYEDMLYDEYAKALAQNARLGFAEMAYRDLARYS